jgi:hypothetical protein
VPMLTPLVMLTSNNAAGKGRVFSLLDDTDIAILVDAIRQSHLGDGLLIMPRLLLVLSMRSQHVLDAPITIPLVMTSPL